MAGIAYLKADSMARHSFHVVPYPKCTSIYDATESTDKSTIIRNILITERFVRCTVVTVIMNMDACRRKNDQF